MDACTGVAARAEAREGEGGTDEECLWKLANHSLTHNVVWKLLLSSQPSQRVSETYKPPLKGAAILKEP